MLVWEYIYTYHLHIHHAYEYFIYTKDMCLGFFFGHSDEVFPDYSVSLRLIGVTHCTLNAYSCFCISMTVVVFVLD